MPIKSLLIQASNCFHSLTFPVHFLLKLRVKIEVTGRERIRPLSIMAYLIYATSYVLLFEYSRRQGLRTVQIKNIKLHIVTDIKVTINSLSVFGFRYLVGGRVNTILKKKCLVDHPRMCRMRGCIHTYMPRGACLYTVSMQAYCILMMYKLVAHLN